MELDYLHVPKMKHLVFIGDKLAFNDLIPPFIHRFVKAAPSLKTLRLESSLDVMKEEWCAVVGKELAQMKVDTKIVLVVTGDEAEWEEEKSGIRELARVIEDAKGWESVETNLTPISVS